MDEHGDDGPSRLRGSVRRFDFGDFFGGEGFEFAADGVGGEAGAEQRTVERGDFLGVDFAALFAAGEEFEFALQARADGGAFRFRVGGVGDGCVDVAVRDAAGAQIAGDAEFALAADFRALAHKLFGVSRVVQLAVFPEPRHDDLDQQLVVCTPRQHFFHFVHGVRAPHQCANGDIVEFGFRFELARFAEHEESMK